MLTEIQRKWLNDLRSGQYTQTVSSLKDGRGYCCLGVAAEGALGRTFLWDEAAEQYYYQPLDAKPHLPCTGMLSPEDVRALGLTEFDGLFCASMNDGFSYNFNQIADLLEARFLGGEWY